MKNLSKIPLLKNVNVKNVKIFKKLLTDYLTEINTKLSFKNKKKISSSINNIVLNKDKKKYILTDNQRAIGILILNFSKNIFSQKVCYVNDIFILKKFRRNGFAKSIIRALILKLKKKKNLELRIEIIRNNFTAINFWKQFRIKKKSTNYIISLK